MRNQRESASGHSPFPAYHEVCMFFRFKFSSSTFVIFLSHGWPLQWQPWCLVLWHSSEMRINKDGSGYKTWCQRLSSKRKIFVVVNFLVPAMITLVYRKTKLFLFFIQAHFRGQRVRRRLNEALRAAQFYDDEGEEEFDYDEEVDLTAFDFDENVLEQGWTPSETPQLPSRSVWLHEESSYVCFTAVIGLPLV